MPLDDLVSVIETLKARIQTHQQELEANETRTRMALIDPFLQAMGWDTTDPTLVLPEYDLSGSRPDYALLDATGKPVAFVEAKRLGESLTSHRMQIVNYANLSGVPYAGLTDGNHWELYKIFAPAPIEDRLLLNVSIADQPAHECALELLTLRQSDLAAIQPVAANEPVLTTATEPVKPQSEAEPEVETPPAPPPSPFLYRLSFWEPGIETRPEQAPAPPPTGVGWVPLSEVDSVIGKTPPTAIRFPDESTRKVDLWWRLPQAIIGWLWSKEKITMSDVPQPSRLDFDGTPLMFEAKTGSKEAVSQAKRLLQERGVNVEDVQLQFWED